MKRLEHELSIITSMKFPGYFLIVADFIQWAKAAGHRRRAGPRLGRGLAGRLRAHHHRPRPAALRSPVRALPQPRARLDAGLRHRLLPGAARRGDRLRPGALRRRPVAQIITFGTLQARAVVRDVGRVLDMPYGKVDQLAKMVPSNPANPVTLGEALKTEPRAPGGPQGRRRGRPAPPDGAEARRPLPPRLHPRRRHRHRRPARWRRSSRSTATRARRSRSSQYNMKWVESAGLVKFDFLGLKTLTTIERALALIDGPIDLDTLPLDDTGLLRAARARRDRRRVPAGKPGDAQGAGRHEAGPVRGHHRHRGALPPRPDGQHPELQPAQAGHRGAGLPPPRAGADPEGDLRHHHLPGAGDADRAGPVRLLARRSRPPAPRHGQEDRRRDGRPARPLRGRRGGARHVSRRTPTTSSTSWRSSPTTASTSRTRPPTRWSPITRPTSRRTTRRNSSPRR